MVSKGGGFEKAYSSAEILKSQVWEKFAVDSGHLKFLQRSKRDLFSLNLQLPFQEQTPFADLLIFKRAN